MCGVERCDVIWCEERKEGKNKDEKTGKSDSSDVDEFLSPPEDLKTSEMHIM